MSKSEKPFNWIEWPKVILCGLFLGSILGYFSYCLRCWIHGIPVSWPINWSIYCVFVSVFHLGEFFLTAMYRPTDLCFNSFLVNQSLNYVISTIIGIFEFWIEYTLFGWRKDDSRLIFLGIVLTLFGSLLRASAEIKMEANFTHIIRKEKDATHELVTTGIYAIFRHPSYTGWFYYCIGREVLLLNPVSFVITLVTTWLIMYYRISYEEKYLLSFFEEYEDYRKHTYTFIPFLPVLEANDILFVLYVCSYFPLLHILDSDWMTLIIPVNHNLVVLFVMKAVKAVKTTKKIIDTIPKVENPWNIILLVVNIIFPGVGTLIGGCVGKCENSAFLVGILQIITFPILIGWIWSILWGLFMFDEKIMKKMIKKGVEIAT